MELSDYATMTEAERWEFRLSQAFAVVRARGLTIVDRPAESPTRKKRTGEVVVKKRGTVSGTTITSNKSKSRASDATKRDTPRTARKKS